MVASVTISQLPASSLLMRGSSWSAVANSTEPARGFVVESEAKPSKLALESTGKIGVEDFDHLSSATVCGLKQPVQA
ncbi:MAG: hypothetical protein QXT28_10255 [Thermofilaceae archaeon]